MREIIRFSIAIIACCLEFVGGGIYAADIDIKIEDACGEVGKIYSYSRFLDQNGRKFCDNLPIYTLKGQEDHFVDGHKYGQSILPSTVLFHSYDYISHPFMCPFTAHIDSLDIVRELCMKLGVSSDGINEYAFTIQDKSYAIREQRPNISPCLMSRPGWEYIRQWIIDNQRDGTKHEGNYGYDAKVMVISENEPSVQTYQGSETCCMHITTVLTHSPESYGIFGKDITKEKMESPIAQAMIYYVKYKEGPLAGQSRIGIIFMYPYKEAKNLQSFLEKCGTYPISFSDVVDTIPIKLRKANDGFLQKLFFREELEDEENEEKE